MQTVQTAKRWLESVVRFWNTKPALCLGLALALGLALRAYHFLRNADTWHDEAALINNVLLKDWGELTGPLYYSEAAPLGFMWLEKAVANSLGDGTLALRLVPWLASCLALILLARSARRLF